MHLLPKLLGYLWKPDVKSADFSKIKYILAIRNPQKNTLFAFLKNNHHLANHEIEVITFIYCILWRPLYLMKIYRLKLQTHFHVNWPKSCHLNNLPT